jgi:hypothetical protein
MASFRLRERIGDTITRVLYSISPLWLVQFRYKKATGKWYRPGNPRTLDEKLLWLMLYWQHPLKSRCADKYAVRSYVQENGLGHLLTDLLGVYTSSQEIDFNSLPDRFVLKCTHGCGFNIICADKSMLDIDEARRKLDAWMKVDISKYGAELHYASIKPRIICEEFLEDNSGKLLDDYKVYCFDGKAHCTMACTDRTERGAKYDFYDREWKNKLAYSKSSLLAKRSIPKPDAYEEIIESAEKLSKPFPFVRVDFYSVNGKAVFGEMTFTPHGSIDTYMTDLAQNIMGDLFKLPERRLQDRPIVRIFDAIEIPFRRFLYHVSPFLLVQYLSLKLRGRLYHPRKVTTFDDKLIWLMLYWRDPLKSTCADKYAVRSYVADQGLGHLLPDVLGVYAASAEIDFGNLPERFVLKCTHGSGFNLICRDKILFDIKEAKKKLDRWMKVDLSKLGGEIHYASIKPRIICETFLGGQSDGSINDYKIYCFSGRPHCAMACTERDTGKTKFDFYDLDWKNKLPYAKSSARENRDIPKPEAFKEILHAAEILSKPFPFVRVDFYSVNGKAVFGEMTFTPNGCIDLDLTGQAQNTMGDLLELPEKLLR